MRHFIATIAALALSLGPDTAFGHGGCYPHNYVRDVPPDSREPSDPPPPPDSNDDPTAAPPFAGRGPGGAKATAWNEWPRWWGCNQEEFLGLRATRRRLAPASRGLSGRQGDSLAVCLDTVRTRVTPPLRALLAKSGLDPDILGAAAIGLARIGDTSIAAELRRLALDEDHDVHKTVRESAALALGLLGDASPETRALLVDLIRSRGSDGSFVRPFAAISLGLLGDTDGTSAAALLEVVARDEPGRDIKPACLLALGLLADERAIPDLVAIVRTGRAPNPGAEMLSELERSYAVAALGAIAKLGDRGEALDAVADLVHRRHDASGMNVRRSAVIALGRIAAGSGARERRRAVELLRNLADDGSADEQERGFALLSLGRLGAAADDGSRTRDVVVAHLGGEVRSGRGLMPAYAALGLGLIGRAACDESGSAPERDIRVPLRNAFQDEESLRIRGAFALASGLVRDPLAADPLVDVLRDEHAAPALRGWCALGLGMIGETRAAEPIRTALREVSDRDLRIQCATAMGLLGEPAAIDDLLAVLADPERSNYELGSAAIALGRIGDERAVGPLVAIATDDENYPDLTRGLAVAALGRIADRRDVPALARVTSDLNYRAAVPALTELMTLL